MRPRLPTITIWEPWATLICYGPKRIENRTWKQESLIGQYIGIHAARRKCDPDDIEYMERCTGRRVPQYGRLLGFAHLDEFLTESDSEWFHGPIGWKLSDVQALDFPQLVTGAQGVWFIGRDWSSDQIEDWNERAGIRQECMPKAHADWHAVNDILSRSPF